MSASLARIPAMRGFITGGSGCIGNAVVAALRRAGHEVVALVRSPDKGRSVEVLGARAHVGFLAEPDTYRDAAAAADAVIHTAAGMGPRMGEVDRAAVEALIAAAGRGGGRLVYTSGVWRYGHYGGRGVVDDTPLAPPGRAAVEETVLASASRGVAATVLRPGCVHGGKAGLFGAHMLGQPGVVRLVGKGENRWATVYVDDLADLYVRAVERGAGGE